MHAKLENWNNGWFGVHLGFSPSEIDLLIKKLEELKKDTDQHFHLSSDYKGNGGIGDVEIFVKTPDTKDNFQLSSLAIPPGSTVGF